MRILFVGTGVGSRGTEHHMLTLALAMRDTGHSTFGLFHPDGFLAQGAKREGLPYEPGVFRNAVDPRGVVGVVRAWRAFHPDWIVGSFGHEYWPISVLGRILGMNVCLFRHLPNPLKGLSLSVLPRLSHRFVAVSEYMRGRLVEAGVPVRNLHLLYNPLQVSRFVPDPEQRIKLRSELGLAETDVLVGYVGSIERNKGAFTFARAADCAMERAGNLKVLWVGQVAAHPVLEAVLSKRFRHNHMIRPWTNSPEHLYPALDVLAVPSEWPEPFGRVAIEAQACGVPVLVSDVGGLPETLEVGVSGELVRPGRVDAWEDALVRMAQRTAVDRQSMGLRGREFVVDRFCGNRIAKEFEFVLRRSGS